MSRPASPARRRFLGRSAAGGVALVLGVHAALASSPSMVVILRLPMLETGNWQARAGWPST